MQCDISEITKAFPEFRVAVLLAEGLRIEAGRPAGLDELIAQREATARARWSGTDLSAIPGIAVWRGAYRAFGIKKTSYRSSVERLLKNVLADRPLPRINTLVDVYNAVSITHVLPAGADDLSLVVGDIAFRHSRPDDSFHDMAGENGAGASVVDPPKEGEIVYADTQKVLCRRWNWRQDARSLVTPDTTSAVITLQYQGAGDLEVAGADLRELLGRFCGGRTEMAIADSARPVAAIP